MEACSYCDESFEDEAAYFEHLEAAHADELSRIDRRRVDTFAEDEDGFPIQAVALGLVGVAVVGFVAYYAFFMGSGGGGDGLASEPLPASGDETWISQVETFQSNGNAHVEPGTEIDYERVPPLSGTHYPTTVSAGFYTETQPLGALVHTLEHGAVVIYYDPAALTPAAEESLRAWARNHRGTWSSIVVVPNPNDDPRGPYVLTAWTHRLTLQNYSAEAVQAFAAEYLGRGPENPVRSPAPQSLSVPDGLPARPA